MKSQSVISRRSLVAAIDRDLAPQGGRAALARALGVDQSTVTRALTPTGNDLAFARVAAYFGYQPSATSPGVYVKSTRESGRVA